MKKMVLAICDDDREYACRLADYLSGRQNLPFEVQVFTSAESLKAYSRQEEPVSLALIGEELLPEAAGEGSRREAPAGTEAERWIVLREQPLPASTGDSVYKYQPSGELLRQIMQLYSDAGAVRESTGFYKTGTRLLGIYSPVSRPDKTSLALTMGQILAKERAVLYLNLENFAGFEELFKEAYDRTLSDLLYCVRQGSSQLLHQLNGMIHSFGNLDYLPPVRVPADLQCVSGEDWEQLLTALGRETAYEYLILDLGDGVPDLFTVLRLCRLVYVPTRPDALSEARIRQFEAMYLERLGKEAAEKLRPIRIPFTGPLKAERGQVEELPWGELGDYARRLLRAEHLI